ncbi:MAG: hypothetical protein LBT54_05850 [Bifidobacteriaceae bacterium]|jgi:uncharacterized protein HemX|nr:hypothetical protein [Bifidobacteriaceae bacterium]
MSDQTGRRGSSTGRRPVGRSVVAAFGFALPAALLGLVYLATCSWAVAGAVAAARALAGGAGLTVLRSQRRLREQVRALTKQTTAAATNARRAQTIAANNLAALEAIQDELALANRLSGVMSAQIAELARRHSEP